MLRMFSSCRARRPSQQFFSFVVFGFGLRVGPLIAAIVSYGGHFGDGCQPLPSGGVARYRTRNGHFVFNVRVRHCSFMVVNEFSSFGRSADNFRVALAEQIIDGLFVDVIRSGS